MKNFKLHIALLLFFFSSIYSYSQQYGNEWINYNQSYYSFKIVSNGVFKLDYSTLAASGIPLNTFQSDNIQIFGREKEVPLYIIDNGDNSIDPGDFILFYAEKNDGWLDSTLYLDPTSIGNPAYSLYNDTIQYFFTWNNSNANLRYSIETDVDFNNYSSIENYILQTNVVEYNNRYHEGVRTSQNSSSFYMPGEGWGSGNINGVPGGYTLTNYCPTPTPYTGAGAPNAIFTGLSTSSSNAASSGSGNHHLRWQIGSSDFELSDSIYFGYKFIKIERSISPTILSNTNTRVKWNIIDDLGAATDYQAFHYLSITYPRTTDFLSSNNFNFEVINNPQGKIRIDATNVGATNPMIFVHGDTPRIVPFVNFGPGRSALIPNSLNGLNQKVVYIDSSQIQNVSNNLVPVNGTGQFTDFLSLPLGIEEALLFIYHPTLNNSSLNYAAHRSSPAGGGYNVLMANINELYQQFGGGIEKHVNGVRRFSHFIYNNSTEKPVGLFLLGKGIREAEYNATLSDGPGTRKNAQRFHASLIPSFGQPSSDVFITANLQGSNPWTPLIPTGRISARTETELDDYLNKIITYDANQDSTSIYDTPSKDWQKHILHFAGGSDINQQQQFQNYMNSYKNIIEDTLFGGIVHNVFKSSSNPLDPTILGGITDRIEKGVSLMGYFGHSSSTTSGFEINLDEPTNWNNTGKYPLMLVNSCYNGNIFQLSNSKSEEFVQVPNLGAIGYIASVTLGFDVYLNLYSRNLYKIFSQSLYGSPIGLQMKDNINYLYQSSPTDAYLETTCAQMTLNGDPMLKLNWHTKPEIELLPENVSFSPSELNLTVDSIEIQIITTNLGHSTLDTFNIEITRNFPSSTVDSVYYFQVPKLNYKDTLRFKVPLQPNIAVGINTFNIRADLPSGIDEVYDEVNNNQIVKTLFINIDGIIPVIPYDFAVVPDDSVTVRASTIDPIAPFKTYRFELDTTDLFNSPMHRYALVSGLGGVKEVNPSEWLSVSTGLPAPLTCVDSMVYFWRVAVDSTVLDWRERSFQYITDKSGWGQDHFFQFKKNGFFGIDYDRPNRERDFGLFSKEVTCDAYSSTSGSVIYNNAWYIDGDQQEYGILNFTPKFHVCVIDPITLTAWKTRFVSTGENLNNNFGNNNDNFFRSMSYFTFHQDDPAKLDAFQNMINNEIPDGHYILIYSPMTTRYDLLNSYYDSTGIYNTFAAIGSDSINGNRINAPFALFYKKGDPSSVVELFAQTPSDDVHLTAFAYGSDAGQESSPLIGPSSKWGNVYWKQDPLEINSNDSTVLTISTYNNAKVFQSKIDMQFTANDSLIDLNSIVNASQYPYISLQAFYDDGVTNTPAQIDRWHVLFDPLPEAAIDGTNLYTWSASDTLNEGETVDFAVDIKNIFSLDMDSLLVSYWIEDANQIKHPIPYARQDSLRVNEVLRDTVTFSTVGLGGISSLWVEVNPFVNGSLYITDQPEQEHFNNLLQIPFYVNADDKNPILDVTFNGTHILNGDIIDPNSEILITLKDDNEFLIMDNVSDTSLFGVYLTYPSGDIKRIPFTDGQGNTIMQWVPAEPQNKRFKIIWPSEFTSDGTYTLMVQGTDRSGNLSGDIEYRVSFEIIHESSITNMMNYPNPFSTSTRFVFTLTGSEEPDDILIQIMTVTGRVVKEINEDELGPIHIGRNITEFAWDGTDEFGDPLANGVYLYRVKAKINGEDIKHRESGADAHFKKDFGKMYLMR